MEKRPFFAVRRLQTKIGRASTCHTESEKSKREERKKAIMSVLAYGVLG